VKSIEKLCGGDALRPSKKFRVKKVKGEERGARKVQKENNGQHSFARLRRSLKKGESNPVTIFHF